MLPTLDREQARCLVELRRALAASGDADERAQARVAWSDPAAFARLLELGLSSRSEAARRIANRLRESLERAGGAPGARGVGTASPSGESAETGAAGDADATTPSVVRVYRGARVS